MTQPLKILFVATEPAPGMVPFAVAIINAFAEAGHQVWALTLSSDECSYRKVIIEKVSLHDKAFPTSIGEKLQLKFYPHPLYEEIEQIASDNEIKNVHFLTGEYGLALHYTKNLNKKFNLVYTVHDLEQHPTTSKEFLTRFKASCFDSFFHLMTLKNIRIANNLVTSSKTQYQVLRQLYPQKNILYHSFPPLITPQIKAGNKICPELKNESNYILFFGTFVSYKGVDLLYNAFLNSCLCQKYKLVLAGKGTYFFKTSKEEKNIIRINRYILDEEIAMLYKKALFVVYPYRQASQSGVVSIAHYFKKRIIASDLPYFKDNISNGDILFKSENVKELIHVLEREANNCSDGFCNEIQSVNIVDELSSIYKL